MAEKEILVKLERDALRDLVPVDPRVTIEHICIGSNLDSYSYVAPVSGNATTGVSGGGTATSSYRVFDLGFGVANTSQVPMRVQMVLSKVDAEGYAIDTRNIWADVSPMEKRRLWANLDLQKRDAFRSYVIKEIGIAEAIPGMAPYVASTSPNKNVYHLLAGSMDALRNNTLLDSLNISMAGQQQVKAVVGKGIRAYLTYVKWVAIVMGIMLLLSTLLGVIAVLIQR